MVQKAKISAGLDPDAPIYSLVSLYYCSDVQHDSMHLQQTNKQIAYTAVIFLSQLKCVYLYCI